MATLTAVDTYFDYVTEGCTAIALQVSGTFVGTITFSVSVDGANFVTAQVLPVGALDTPVTTTTAGGIWVLNLLGIPIFRAKMTSYTSGTAQLNAFFIQK